MYTVTLSRILIFIILRNTICHRNDKLWFICKSMVDYWINIFFSFFFYDANAQKWMIASKQTYFYYNAHGKACRCWGIKSVITGRFFMIFLCLERKMIYNIAMLLFYYHVINWKQNWSDVILFILENIACHSNISTKKNRLLINYSKRNIIKNNLRLDLLKSEAHV